MRPRITEPDSEEGVSSLLEYVFISGILMILLVIMMLYVNATLMEGPAYTLSYAAYTDIGNGISTRIIDVYVIRPDEGNITTKFDIPDEVANSDYFVEIGSSVGSPDQVVEVSRNDIKSSISLAGIGSTRGVRGNTTGKGLNKITYDSLGV